MTFIDECEDQPFFCYLAPILPTHPRRPGKVHPTLPRRRSERNPFDLLGHDREHRSQPRAPDELPQETGRDENTIVIMVNDNGVTEGLGVYNARIADPSVRLGKAEPGRSPLALARKVETQGPGQPDRTPRRLPTLCDLAGSKSRPKSKTNSKDTPSAPCSRGKANRMAPERILSTTWPVGPAVSKQHKYSMAGVRRQSPAAAQS